MTRKKEEKLDPQESIMRLLVAQLILDGVTTDTIGKILGVDGSTVRRMVPASELSKQSNGKKAK